MARPESSKGVEVTEKSATPFEDSGRATHLGLHCFRQSCFLWPTEGAPRSRRAGTRKMRTVHGLRLRLIEGRFRITRRLAEARVILRRQDKFLLRDGSRFIPRPMPLMGGGRIATRHSAEHQDRQPCHPPGCGTHRPIPPFVDSIPWREDSVVRRKVKRSWRVRA